MVISKTKSTRPKARGSEPERSKKKNLRLHQSKIDAARAALGTRTETETVEAALDLVVFRREVVKGVRALRGATLGNPIDEGAS